MAVTVARRVLGTDTMSPAARLRHARHALAGLLVPASWIALAGAAHAGEADAPATTTTTEAPSTTTTAPPAFNLPKDARKKVQAAQAFLDSMPSSPAPDAGAPAAGSTPSTGDGTGAAPAISPTAPASIRIEDLLAAIPGRRTGGTSATATGAPASTTAAPTGATAPAPPVTGIPTGDRSTSGPPAPTGTLAFSPGPAPAPTSGWPGLVSGAPAPLVDPAVGAWIGGQPAAGPGSASAQTGQAENPERGPPAAAVTTGDATATGNRTVTTIDQSTLVAVTRRGTVSLTTAENRDTGARWTSATLPSGLLAGHDPRLLAMVTGDRTGNGTATITTGDALAIGNDSMTTINQSTIVAVTAKGKDVVVDQPAFVANVGSAAAGTGGNTALGTGSDGNGSSVISTGDAFAYGNRSTTVINQATTVVVTGANSHVRIAQSADVDNIGTATAGTGDNIATGTTGSGDGTTVLRTGDAVAVGNQSQTTITQTGTAVVTGGRSTVNIDQHAGVNNVGTATASTGGNAAVATSGGANGSVLITTGNASATGNQAGTTITQRGINITTGKFAGISITQDAGVVNRGTAVATTGRNTAVGAG
jgi:hypothetical protein